jgi:hypothetical protein
MVRACPRRSGVAVAAVSLLLAAATSCSDELDVSNAEPDSVGSRTGLELHARDRTSGHGPQKTPDPSAEATMVADPADRVLRGDESFLDGFTVPAGEVWEFAPGVSTTVASGGNVVVEGVLRMRPDDYDITHTLQFVDIDESEFVGGGMGVLPTDVGLWVIGAGQLDIVGSPRAGWNRTGTDPTWQPDDEVRVAPTVVGDSTTFAEFEPGSSVPTVSYAGETYPAEVFNLTRNVRIQGTGDGEANVANGRAHIWINSTKPQSIRYAELRHLGPRQVGDSDNPSKGVHGRYPLHFHMAEDGTQGSFVEGVVVRDSGHHAFVAHKSHGITFRDTIAFNVFDDAYWWDPDDTGHGRPAQNATNDLVYEHAMAALVRSDPDFRGYTLTGFLLGEGENLTVTDSVAVGIQGNVGASGFHWPATANGNEHNLWKFRDNVAHNNRTNGIFVWQNDHNDHLIERFVGYRNGAFGVDHGAYGNRYHYDGLVLFENAEAGIRSRAADTGGQRWNNVDTDGILIGERSLSSDSPIVFDGLTLRGKIVVNEGEGEAVYEFHNSRTAEDVELSKDDFEVRRQVSTIIVHLSDGNSFDL